MDPDYGIPGLGTYQSPEWQASAPSGEATAMASSRSQVPGTSGAPAETPSAYHGVSSGAGTGTPGPAFGSLAGLLGLGGGGGSGAAPAGGAISPAQRAAMSLAGMRMLQPQGNPLRPGAPPATLSSAGMNPMVQQYMQMFGVDPSTAQMMVQLLHPGGTAMTPGQQAQNVFGGGAFMPPSQQAAPPSPLLPSSAMPTPQNPYAVPRDPGTLTQRLPTLGAGAFPTGSATPQPLSAQMLYGSLA